MIQGICPDIHTDDKFIDISNEIATREPFYPFYPWYIQQYHHGIEDLGALLTGPEVLDTLLEGED